MTGEQPEIVEFDKCPCGETETYVGRFRRKMEEDGTDLTGYPTHLITIPAVMQKESGPLYIGQKAPAGQAEMDLCMGCGVLRAVRIITSVAISLPISNKHEEHQSHMNS